jgi:cytochrome c
MGMFERVSARLILAGYVMFSAGAAIAETGDLQKQVAGGNVEAGERLAMRCKACHTLDKDGANKLGPNLWGVIGRPKATVGGFTYSNALTKLDGSWTLEELDKFLTDPRRYAPGNRMAFAGLRKAGQRHDLLAYLSTLGDKKPAIGTSEATAKTDSDKPAEAEPTFADELGLPKGEGREDVAALCSACHSLLIVKQQGLDADRWDGLMDWMTEKQGMPALEPEDRTRIVSYLAEHYGPQSSSRSMSPMNPMNPMMPTMPRMPAMPPQKQ